MGTAVALPEPVERPSLLEVILVLVVCAGLLVGLGVMDDRAQRREAAKAAQVIQERADRSAQRAERESMTAPSAPAYVRTDRLGRESSPIVIPAGPAWGPGTSVVSHTQKRDPRPQTPPEIRRIDGAPTPASVARANAQSAKPSAPPSASSGRTDAGPVLLILMGLAGLSMIAGGLRLLTRRPQPPVGVTR